MSAERLDVDGELLVYWYDPKNEDASAFGVNWKSDFNAMSEAIDYYE